MLQDVWQSIVAHITNWVVGAGLGIASLWGFVTWWRLSRRRRTRDQELDTRLSAVSDISRDEAGRAQTAMDQEIEERVQKIRAEADSARTEIRARFGGKSK